MEEIKQGWKKRISWLLIAIVVVIVYKVLDNFENVQQGLMTFFRILKPFFIGLLISYILLIQCRKIENLIGLLISYILLIPCRKIENLYKKSRFKFIQKRVRGLSVVTTYILALLIIIIVINCIFPILKDSVVELFGNIPGYYETVINKFKELP